MTEIEMERQSFIFPPPIIKENDYIPSVLLDQAKIKNDPNDSLCTRYIRKKFLCIMTFLFSIIAAMQILNTVVNKLSNDDITSLYGHILKKFSIYSAFSSYNSSEISK